MVRRRRSVLVFASAWLPCLGVALCADLSGQDRAFTPPPLQSAELLTKGIRRIFLELRLAETEPVRGLTIEAGVKGSNKKTYIHYAIVVTNADVLKATAVEKNGQYSVKVVLSPEGTAKMAASTSRHRGRPLAIILDGEVVGVMTIPNTRSDEIVIPGEFTREEATRISTGLVW